MFIKLKDAARRIKLDALTVYFVARDPMTPFLVRFLAFAVGAYAVSPIDLIPDFIPILGYLDDLVILPLGIALVIKLTPPSVIESSRKKASEVALRPNSNLAAIAIVALWSFCVIGFGYWLLRGSGS